MKNIVVLENGPIIIEVEDTKFALCRCGQTANKPFCDGTHKQCEFRGEPIQLWPEVENENQSA